MSYKLWVISFNNHLLNYDVTPSVCFNFVGAASLHKLKEYVEPGFSAVTYSGPVMGSVMATDYFFQSVNCIVPYKQRKIIGSWTPPLACLINYAHIYLLGSFC